MSMTTDIERAIRRSTMMTRTERVWVDSIDAALESIEDDQRVGGCVLLHEGWDHCGRPHDCLEVWSASEGDDGWRLLLIDRRPVACAVCGDPIGDEEEGVYVPELSGDEGAWWECHGCHQDVERIEIDISL